ncbi:MAG: hypothetical protein NUW01_16880 [Gemmatimonadaceae bacterium]|nr:hypothetical protein [Gemmatimonadaceae bacterium]
MRFSYKVIPLQNPHPAFPKETSMWIPVLHVRINNSAKHSPPTKRFEAIVDSGAPECYFHADIGKAIGIRLEDGIASSIGGIVGGVKIPIYYHSIGLYVGADILQMKAGFSNKLSVAAILGRRGFFDNFIVTFDPGATPPGFDIQRLGRA